MEQSKQTPKKKAYDAEYRRKNLKRVPLDVQKSEYADLKAAADSAGMNVNEYIKVAIREKMTRDTDAPGTVSNAPESPSESNSPPGGILTPAALEAATEAAQKAGETPSRDVLPPGADVPTAPENASSGE